MAYTKKSYLEHVALKVKDIRWHIQFFTEALGFDIREVSGNPENPEQIWIGGIQLTSAPDFKNYDHEEERIWHIGIFTKDLEAALNEVYLYGEVSEMPQGRNWFMIPDGIMIELSQASSGEIQKYLEIKPRG